MNAVPAGDFSLVKTCRVSGDPGGFQLDLQRAANRDAKGRCAEAQTTGIRLETHGIYMNLSNLVSNNSLQVWLVSIFSGKFGW